MSYSTGIGYYAGYCPSDMYLLSDKDGNFSYQGGYTCVETHNPFGETTTPGEPTTQSELATTMVLRGAVGTVIGAAVSPKGSEGIWGAIGFGMGAILGEMGILGVALAALWKKV